MHLTTLGAFIALEIALCFIPGPAVLSVVGAALSQRKHAGYATALGILTGNALYFIVSALGVASIIIASRPAFMTIKWCGAAYLAYLGVRALLTRASDVPHSIPAPAEDAVRRGWINGTIVQLSNPKAMIFFTAILPQFIDPHGNLLLQITILGFAGLAIEFGVLSFYVSCADRIAQRGVNTTSQVWAERIGGAFLVGVAAAVVRETL